MCSSKFLQDLEKNNSFWKLCSFKLDHDLQNSVIQAKDAKEPCPIEQQIHLAWNKSDVGFRPGLGADSVNLLAENRTPNWVQNALNS